MNAPAAIDHRAEPVADVAVGADLTLQLGQIVAQISRVMDAEGCTVYLHDAATGEIWSRVMSNAGGSQEIRLKVGEGLAGRVMQTGETLNIKDAQGDRRHASKYDRAGFITRSVLCSPLVAPNGERIGVVQVLNKRGGPFGDADVDLLAALNSQVAIALENARLLSDLSSAQQAERDLAEQLASKHRELQGAFSSLEAAKTELETNLRRIQLMRLGAVVGGILLFAAFGLFALRSGRIDRGEAAGTAAVPVDAAAGHGRNTVVVSAGAARAGIPLASTVEPLRIVNLSAGIDGTLTEIGFDYGQRVVADQLLVRIDTTAAQVELRLARAEVIQAEERLRELTAWKDSRVVTEARRALIRAESNHREAERRAAETERLFSKGIVGGDERDGAVRELESVALELTSAREDLARAEAEGGAPQLRVARMALENAQVAEAAIVARIATADVLAPIDGVILLPLESDDAARLEVGRKVTVGDALLQIGDLSGLSLRGSLDQVEVAQVKIGQPALITTSAIPEMELRGEVRARASQGRWDDRARGQRFDVVIAVDPLPPAWAERVLLGMSATMEILLRESADALQVPVAAVRLGDAEPWVEVVDPGTGAIVRRVVALGLTSVDAVEVVSGLQIGDEVVLP